MTEHRTGTREEWQRARVELQELEKLVADHFDNIPPGRWWWPHDEYEDRGEQAWRSR